MEQENKLRGDSMSDMQAILVDSMGNDLTVVNAARVSFNSHSDLLNTKDEGLITFLAKHGHWSPFAHVMLQFRMKAPIFVARQLVKHQVGLTWNEISRRYVDSDIEFYEPKVWRKAAANVKQGSSDESSGWGPCFKGHMTSQQLALAEYFDAIDSGVCMEQARMLLPQSMMTEWYWTGSLVAFARIVKQRTHSTAQLETQEVALLIKKALDEKETITHSWRALCL
jgi:thymidylate synthase (FAD)